MSLEKLPFRLLSTRQYAVLIGKNTYQVRDLLKKGRIPRAQWVDDRYVIPEDASILRSGLPTDAKLFKGIPAELISDKVVKQSWRELPERPINADVSSLGENKKVIAWNYDKYTKGMGMNEIYRTTGVHRFTQHKLKNKEPVKGSVIYRLAVNLGIDVEDLLRRE